MMNNINDSRRDGRRSAVFFAVLTAVLYPLPNWAESAALEIDHSELTSSVCQLHATIAENRQWLAFEQRVETAATVKSPQKKMYQMVIASTSQELAQLQAEYKAATGRTVTAQSCSLKVDIFLGDTPADDVDAVSEALCQALSELETYRLEEKSIRSEMAKVGVSPQPEQRYQWARDRMYIEGRVAALKKAYKAAAGRAFQRSAVCISSNE
jgi:hypothetical protein